MLNFSGLHARYIPEDIILQHTFRQETSLHQTDACYDFIAPYERGGGGVGETSLLGTSLIVKMRDTESRNYGAFDTDYSAVTQT
jgi:hypothetical protein